MIWFDVTKAASARHKSGLNRLSARLKDELGDDARPAAWTEVRDRAAPDDWFVTGELFSEPERPGFGDFIRSGRCRTAAIFADAIPLKHPHITWPHSVARHPAYMKLLADFERVWAISFASREELAGYWRWLGREPVPPIDVLPLGADLSRAPRGRAHASSRVRPSLLCVGILEPRKNQALLLDVAERLWREGLAFDLHLVGRVNPHFGRPLVARIKALRKVFPGLHYHEAASDAVLAGLYAGATATLCPTIAEGCGLPLLESLWHGVPCVCSDLAVLRENAAGGGCLAVPADDRDAWSDALRRILREPATMVALAAEAATRPLPTWAEAAAILRDGLAK